MLENIDTSLIDWSRAQFALTAIYHWIFVPLTLGLAVIMGIMETVYYRTGDNVLETYCQVLDETLRHQFCHRCGNGTDSGV